MHPFMSSYLSRNFKDNFKTNSKKKYTVTWISKIKSIQNTQKTMSICLGNKIILTILYIVQQATLILLIINKI